MRVKIPAMKIWLRCMTLWMVLVLAVSCTAAPAQNIAVEDELLTGGGTSPETTVETFLNDLNKALKDPAINRTDVRDQWADTLAEYFFPLERTAQRVAIRTSLDNVAAGIAQLSADQSVLFEISYEPARRVDEREDVVFIEVPNATIDMVISQNSNRGNTTIWKQTESLGYLIGSDENVFPVARVGNRWYLTEN
ncbi:MAG: hypothetical protein RLZZ297_1120 [Chloroflexota bacterium]